MARFGTPWVAVADGETLLRMGAPRATSSGPRGRRRPRRLAASRCEPFVSRVSSTTPLREALDVIVNARSRMAVVVDGDRYRGMITIDELAGGLES